MFAAECCSDWKIFIWLIKRSIARHIFRNLLNFFWSAFPISSKYFFWWNGEKRWKNRVFFPANIMVKWIKGFHQLEIFCIILVFRNRQFNSVSITFVCIEILYDIFEVCWKKRAIFSFQKVGKKHKVKRSEKHQS